MKLASQHLSGDSPVLRERVFAAGPGARRRDGHRHGSADLPGRPLGKGDGRPNIRIGAANPVVPRHADRHQIEFWAMAFVRIAAQLTGTRMRPVRIAFAQPRCTSPDRAEEVEAILGCRVAYGASHDEVAFLPPAGTLPLIGADPFLNNLLVGYCEEALSHRRRPPEALRTQVENAITPLLPHGKARVGRPGTRNEPTVNVAPSLIR